MQKISRLTGFPITVILCFLIILWASVPVSASGNPVSINDMLNNMSAYDGREITVTGEAIGECLARRNGCWINISDGSNAIGIWMAKEDAGRIGVYGDYKHTGDTITVTGVFYSACHEHGGEPDIHCNRLTIENAGTERRGSLPIEKILTAVGIVSAALILFLVYAQKNRSAGR